MSKPLFRQRFIGRQREHESVRKSGNGNHNQADEEQK